MTQSDISALVSRHFFQHQLLSLLRLRGTNLHRDRCHSEPKIGVQRYA